MACKEIKAEELDRNVFRTIGKDWLLIGAEAGGKLNAMTASWGGMGVLWGKNVAYLFLRPSRYTKELLDQSDGVTISVFGEERRQMMNYFGTVSGRDEDKIAKSGLTVLRDEAQAYFEEAELTFFCRKLYAQPLGEEFFLDESQKKWYSDDTNNGYHVMYIVEIGKILVRE